LDSSVVGEAEGTAKKMGVRVRFIVFFFFFYLDESIGFDNYEWGDYFVSVVMKLFFSQN
jgi:hypothetical protein